MKHIYFLILFLAIEQINCMEIAPEQKSNKRKSCDAITNTFVRMSKKLKFTSPPEIDMSEFIETAPCHNGIFSGYFNYCTICGSSTYGGEHAYREAFRKAVAKNNSILAFEIYDYFDGMVDGGSLFLEVIQNTTNIELIKKFVEKYNIDINTKYKSSLYFAMSLLIKGNLQYANVITFLLEEGLDIIFSEELEGFRHYRESYRQQFEMLQEIYKNFLLKRKKIINQCVPVHRNIHDIINDYL